MADREATSRRVPRDQHRFAPVSQRLRRSVEPDIGLGPSRLLGNVELYELTLAPKSRHESAPHPPGTVEGVYVMSGVVRVGVGSVVRDAGPGDTIFFGADSSHHYENPGRVPAKVINAIVYAKAP